MATPKDRIEQLHHVAYELVRAPMKDPSSRFVGLLHHPDEWAAVLTAAAEMARDGCEHIPDTKHAAVTGELLAFTLQNRQNNARATEN